MKQEFKKQGGFTSVFNLCFIYGSIFRFPIFQRMF
jgi:hypothetical protein